MNKHLPILFICILATISSHAQFTRYIVRFKDKGTNPFSISNPSQYLTQRALDRRTRYNIVIDSIDLPVTPKYIDSVRLSGTVTILNVSKWLNQVSIETTDALALAKINNLPFVIAAEPIAARVPVNPVNKSLDYNITDPNAGSVLPPTTQNVLDVINYGQSYDQVRIHQGNFLHNHGFRGEGMHMAVLDAGFINFNTLPTFDSMLLNNQLLGTWDFVDNESSVSEDFYHGTQCLSTIAADMPGVFVGTAPKTSFYLYRTEDVSSEYPIEEHNWAVGAERADSLGVDVCSTSLGYSEFDNPVFDYTHAMLDGNTTMSARAADIAAQKGMLMVNAAGNEGNGGWHFLITPSDADSILAVGAVNTSGQVASFSSYGPSGDNQVKPAVAAVGWNAVVANTSTGQPAFNSGTSFACPNMAGITTCLWQAFPEVNNMTIIDALERSATQFDNPNDRVGYGIPDAKKAFVSLQKMLFTKQAAFLDCRANIEFAIKTDNTMNIDVERKFPGETGYTTITTLQDNAAYGMHDFEYSDDLTGTNFPSVQYRLKMTIGADTTFYLDSMTVNYANSCIIPPTNEISIGPNPVTDILNIRIARTAVSKIDIVLQNAAGQKVYSSSYTQQPGILTKQIPMALYSKGAYFVSIYIGNRKELTKKILIQ